MADKHLTSHVNMREKEGPQKVKFIWGKSSLGFIILYKFFLKKIKDPTQFTSLTHEPNTIFKPKQ